MTFDPVRILRLGAIAGSAFLACAGPVAAQTVLTPVAPAPAVAALQDRVDALEAELRRVTGENEKLDYELRLAREENVKLKQQLGVADPAPVLGAPPADPVAAPIAAPAPTADAALLYAQGKEALAAGDFVRAEQSFAAYLVAAADKPDAAEARYWLGHSLLVQQKNAEAAAAFLDVVKKTPKAAKAPDAYARLGVALARLGKKVEACATLKDVPARYPAAPAATKTFAANEAKRAACA